MVRESWRISTEFGEFLLVPSYAASSNDRSKAERLWEPDLREIDRFTLVEICEELDLLSGDFSRISTPDLCQAVGRALDSGDVVAIRIRRNIAHVPGPLPVGSDAPAAPREPAPQIKEPAPEKKKAEILISIQQEPGSPFPDDAKFVLRSANGSYRSEKTPRDDRIPGNDSVDLLFAELEPEQSYTLEIVEPALAQPIVMFQGVPFRQLSGVAANQSAPAEAEASGGDLVEAVRPGSFLQFRTA